MAQGRRPSRVKSIMVRKTDDRRGNNQLIDLAEPHRAFPKQEKNDRGNDPQRPVAFPHKVSLENPQLFHSGALIALNDLNVLNVFK